MSVNLKAEIKELEDLILLNRLSGVSYSFAFKTEEELSAFLLNRLHFHSTWFSFTDNSEIVFHHPVTTLSTFTNTKLSIQNSYTSLSLSYSFFEVIDQSTTLLANLFSLRGNKFVLNLRLPVYLVQRYIEIVITCKGI